MSPLPNVSCIPASIIAKPLRALAVLLALGGCEVRTVPQQEEVADSLAALDASAVPTIPGNAGHNLIAGKDRLERAMALASVVKTIERIPRCSPERTLFQGSDGKSAFWSLQCHTGNSYRVQIKRDGSGGVVSCDLLNEMGIKSDCWTRWPAK